MDRADVRLGWGKGVGAVGCLALELVTMTTVTVTFTLPTGTRMAPFACFGMS